MKCKEQLDKTEKRAERKINFQLAHLGIFKTLFISTS